jgi:hypothetical protein
LSTPREYYGTVGKTIFSMVPFFYLQKLLEKNPKFIYDLGAGWNIFKKYIPNIIGISPTTIVDNYSDIHDLVDADFVKGHQEYFESVFSINALHFRPLNELENIVQEFSSMVATGGRGFLALNIARMIPETSDSFLMNEFGSLYPNVKDYDTYIRKILSKIDLNYLIVDIDLDILDESMDGNIRIVFEK